MTDDASPLRPAGAVDVFTAFLRLGLTSFGGPIAHLGYFHQALIVRRRWLDEQSYADIIGLCQFLPGPASSQVGIAIGLAKAGWRGAVAAWLGFTLPSAVLMTLIGLGLGRYRAAVPAGLLHGLVLVAVPVVAQAVWLMARRLCPDRPRQLMALSAAVVLLLTATPLMQPVVIVAGGLAGWLLLRQPAAPGPAAGRPRGIGKGFAGTALLLFVLLLLGLPLAAAMRHDQILSVTAGFYRAGALVFGGGHVVLPLLQSTVVPPGWISKEGFLAGYGAAQAMPGPLFSFASYLGAVMNTVPNGAAGAILCLMAIYLPSFLLIAGTIPFWDFLRHRAAIRGALAGINAVVVGLLLAALYSPVWTSAIHGAADMAIALTGFALIAVFRAPPWLVVVLSAAGGWLAASLG